MLQDNTYESTYPWRDWFLYIERTGVTAVFQQNDFIVSIP